MVRLTLVLEAIEGTESLSLSTLLLSLRFPHTRRSSLLSDLFCYKSVEFYSL